MKATNSLLVLGVFTMAGIVTMSCGGSSGSDDDTNTAGTSSTSAGTTSKAGTTSNAAGTSASSAGTSGNGTGGTASNNGGTSSMGGRPDFLGGAGALNVAACPTGTKDGGTCTLATGARNACQLNETTYCSCAGDTDPAWICLDTNDLGAGGQGAGNLQATCPASPMNGDDCSGYGLCPDSTCVCLGSKVRYCQ